MLYCRGIYTYHENYSTWPGKNAIILSPEDAELIQRKVKLAKLAKKPGFSSLYYKHLKRIKKQKRIARIVKNQSKKLYVQIIFIIVFVLH